MTTVHPLWSDDYWPLLMQLYMQKPAGVKSQFSHPVVELGISLHIPPRTIHELLLTLDRHESKSLARLWDTYSANPRRLTRDVKRLRQMTGFGDATAFYDGVLTGDATERSYRPVDGEGKLTPVMLVIILGLYFELTPNTMVSETPEVLDTARLLALKPEEVVGVLCLFQTFDPILRRKAPQPSPTVDEARRVWQKYNNESPEKLRATVAELKEYFE